MPNEFCEVAELTRPVVPVTTNDAADDAAPSSLLRHYEAIAQASCAMLAAARRDDWIEVASQEERCCGLIATLKAAAQLSDVLLSERDDARRMHLLRQILADDAQIRGYAEAWLDPIAAYISTPRAGETNQER